MSDYKTESVVKAIAAARESSLIGCGADAKSIAWQLEAEGWTPPPPPQPVIEVSDAAVKAYMSSVGLGVMPNWVTDEMRGGLRAAFKVMLREALEKMPASAYEQEAKTYTSQRYTLYPHLLYPVLTGEEWPT